MAYEVGAGAPADRALVAGRSWVSWGAVFSGALIGTAVMTLLGLFWYAIAATGPNFVSDNIAWFLGASAIVATFLAGLFAGWFVSGHGSTIGVVHGLTEWGLLTFAVVIVGPGLATVFRSLLVTGRSVAGSTWLWASFWSVLIGLVVAVLGGALGGSILSPRAGTTATGAPLAPADAGSQSRSPAANTDRVGPEHRDQPSDPYRRAPGR